MVFILQDCGFSLLYAQLHENKEALLQAQSLHGLAYPTEKASPED